MLENPDYDAGPSFFSSDIIEDRGGLVGTRSQRMTIRIQRGSYREEYSDGIMHLHPGRQCDPERCSACRSRSRPRGDAAGSDDALSQPDVPSLAFRREYWTVPGILEAPVGHDHLRRDLRARHRARETEITAHFEDVVFADPTRDDRIATLSGDFSFRHQRGRPAQSFP